MLPNKLPKSRILRYGYESKWFGQDAVKTRLQNIAELLLHFLKSDDDRQVLNSSSYLVHCNINLTSLAKSDPACCFRLSLFRGSYCGKG